MRRLLRSSAVLVPTLALTLGLAACGSSSGSGTPSAGSTSSAPASATSAPSAAPSASGPTKQVSCDSPSQTDLAAATAAPTSAADYDKLLTILLKLCSIPATSANTVTVTGDTGKAPTLGKPAGDPPKKLVIKDLVVGTGQRVGVNGSGSFQYTGIKWADGTQFDSSWKTGKAFPASLASGVIPGWQVGLPGMKVGGRRLLVIPPDLAYGAQAGHPLEKDTLVFVVDLVAVTKP